MRSEDVKTEIHNRVSEKHLRSGGIMRKISLVITVVVLLAGVSVQAQKKHRSIQPIAPPVEVQNVCVQDDDGDGFFIFNPLTGAFKCYMCEYNFVWSGVGGVKVDGCNVYFSAVTDSYRMFLSVNVCEQQGKAALEILKLPGSDYDIEPMVENWTDTNMRDDTMECTAAAKSQPVMKPPLPSIHLNELVVQNDANGSYLVINADTGAYKFFHCEDNSAMSGVGEVKIDGCAIYLSDIGAGYRVLASFNVCSMEGKAAVEIFEPLKTQNGLLQPMQEYIGDNNLTDNTTLCGAKN